MNNVRHLRYQFCFFAAILCAVFSSAVADTVIWNQNTTDVLKWTDEGVWTSHAPTSADDVTIANTIGQNAYVQLDTVAEAKTLNIGQMTSTTGTLDIVTGGSLTLSGSTRLGSNSAWGFRDGNNLLKVSGGSFAGLDISVGLMPGAWPGDNSTYDGDAGIEISDGTFSCSAITLGNASATNRLTHYTQSGGTATVNGKLQGNGVRSQFTLSGGTLKVTSPASFLAGFNVSGGRLELGDSLALPNAAAPDGYEAVISGGMVTNYSASAKYLSISGGALTMTDGILHFKNDIYGSISLDAPADGSSRFNLGGGSVTVGYFNFGTSGTSKGQNVFCQTGGTLRINTYLQFYGKGTTENRIEISGGTFTLGIGYGYGFPVMDATEPVVTFCVRGTPNVEFYRTVKTSTVRMHTLYQIDRRGLNPIQLTSGNYGAAGTVLTANQTVHPYGGFQLVTNDCFALVDSSRTHLAITCDRTMRLPDEGLWHTGFLPDSRYSWHTEYLWGVTLTNTAAVVNGFTSAKGVPYGYYALEGVRASKLRKAYARLFLVPQGTNTLEGLVAGIERGGYAAKLETLNGCNVRIDLPVTELGEKATNRKLLFDFTSEDSAAAANAGETTTNALVTAFRFETVKSGLAILVK